MRNSSVKRNTPIVTLIKNYINKKSGKVAESRNEIQIRFDYLDWKDQKKIVLAFLQSGKTDRLWAYTKILDLWDKSFESIVKELWEQFHEERCSWVVIRNFPIEYLKTNINMFTKDRDYFFLCLRLAKNKNFVIDKDKLSLPDYLAILFHTGRSICEEEANNILYKIVHKICVKGFTGYERQLDRYADSDRGTIISPINFHDVSLAIYYIKKLNCNTTYTLFEEWNHSVQVAIYNSLEYKVICKEKMNNYEYREAAICVARKYAYLALDNKYKKLSDPDIETVLEPKEWFDETLVKQKNANDHNISTRSTILNEMMDNNPSIEKVVESFELDTKEETLLPF